ncbi:Zn-ribbon domain-containing OB-fold protein OS=Streptomyces cyaneofuscatus OX=66883 GN=G3I52_19280 PE=4 SV=1 [Streptomyces cyaneofuscatus]
MMTEVVECAHGDLRIGMGLTVTFREAVPVFRPGR